MRSELQLCEPKPDMIYCSTLAKFTHAKLLYIGNIDYSLNITSEWVVKMQKLLAQKRWLDAKTNV